MSPTSLAATYHSIYVTLTTTYYVIPSNYYYVIPTEAEGSALNGTIGSKQALRQAQGDMISTAESDMCKYR